MRCPVCGCTLISIHALLAESDTSQPHCAGSFAISIHALLAESDPIISSATSCRWLFLSTLSLRRATCAPVAAIGHRLRISIHALLAESDRRPCFSRSFLSNFYPRSPCGERRMYAAHWRSFFFISIHALLAESDCSSDSFNVYFSIISIHALLAESDVVAVVVILSTGKFLSTLSLRRATGNPARRPIGRRHFYPRSPCGERRCQADKICKPVVISIHALLAESDNLLRFKRVKFQLFLSTLSLRRATRCWMPKTVTPMDFYPRSPCGERPANAVDQILPGHISIHALLAESDSERCEQ